MIRNHCSRCQGAYGVDENSRQPFVICPHCEQKNPIRRPPTSEPIVAKMVEPQRPVRHNQTYSQQQQPAQRPQKRTNIQQPRSVRKTKKQPLSDGAKIALIVLGSGGLALLLVIGIGLVAWRMFAVPTRAEVAQNAATIDRSKAAPPNALAAPSAVIRTGSTNPVSYQFTKGQPLVYELNLRTPEPTGKFNGSEIVVLMPTHNAGEKIPTTAEIKLPLSDRRQTGLMNFRIASLSKFPGFGLRDYLWFGEHTFSRNGKLLLWQDHVESTGVRIPIPLLMEPIEELAILQIPDDRTKPWREEFTMERMSNAQQQAEPNQAALELFEKRFDKYATEYLRKQGEQDRKPSEKVTVRVQTNSQLVSETEQLLVMDRKVEAESTDSSEFQLNIRREETITFDKQKKQITSLLGKGRVEIVIEGQTETLPFDYSLKQIEGGMFESAFVGPLASKGVPAIHWLKEIENFPVASGTTNSQPVTPDKSEVANRTAATDQAIKDWQAARDAEELQRREAARNRVAETEKQLQVRFADSKNLTAKSLALSPTGDQLAVGTIDNKICVFDVNKNRRVEYFEDLEGLGQVVALAYSADGKFLLAGGYTGRIEISRFDDDHRLVPFGKFVGHSRGITSLAIDPSGQYVLSGDADKIARLWDLKTQREVVAVREFTAAVTGAGFADQGKTAVAVDRETAVYINVSTGQMERQRKNFRNGSAHDIAFSPDGSQFAVSDGYDMQIYETETASKTTTLTGKAIAWKLAFTSDGQHLVAGVNSLVVWSINQKKIVSEFDLGDNINVQSVAVSADGQYISGAGMFSSAGIPVFRNPISAEDLAQVTEHSPAIVPGDNPFDNDAASSGTEPSAVRNQLPEIHCQFPEQGWGIDALSFSPDSKFLYAGKIGLKVFDVQRKREIDNHDRFEEGDVVCIATSPDGRRVLTGMYSGKIILWEPDSRGQLTKVGQFVGHSSKVTAISVGPDNQTVLSGESKRARIWDLKTQRELHSLEFERDVSACRILPNGKAALASDGIGLTIVQLPGLNTWRHFDKLSSYSRSAALSLNGDRMAVANSSDLQLFDTQSANAGGKMKTEGVVWTTVFHPDDQHLLTGGRGKIAIWQIATSTKLAELDVPSGYIQCLAISPDGKYVAAIPSSAGQTLSVFNTPNLD